MRCNICNCPIPDGEQCDRCRVLAENAVKPAPVLEPIPTTELIIEDRKFVLDCCGDIIKETKVV